MPAWAKLPVKDTEALDEALVAGPNLFETGEAARSYGRRPYGRTIPGVYRVGRRPDSEENKQPRTPKMVHGGG
jgi:hypothetical protein